MGSHNKKEKFGWCLYDWANSAFATTILAAILPVYFAESIVPENGAHIVFMGWKGCLSATSRSRPRLCDVSDDPPHPERHANVVRLGTVNECEQLMGANLRPMVVSVASEA